MTIQVGVSRFDATEQGVQYIAVLTAERARGSVLNETVSAKSQSELADGIRDKVRLMVASFFTE